MSNKIIFYLPEFYEASYSSLNLIIIKLMKEKPEIFYDNIQIGAIYGCFPGMIWNGGRSISGGTSLEKVKEIIDFYYKNQIPLRFTLTNCLIEKNHLNDVFCNIVMKEAQGKNNEILVNSSLLENYLRTNYPQYNYLLSTTKCERKIENINKIAKDYKLIVLDYRDAKNNKFLKQIKNKDKIEILLNDYCRPNCQYRAKHYANLSKEQLSFGYPESTYQCNYNYNSFYDLFNSPSFVSLKDIKKIYIPKGIHHFKIVGRTTHLVDLIESYIYYLIKPKYADIIRNELLRMCWN